MTSESFLKIIRKMWKSWFAWTWNVYVIENFVSKKISEYPFVEN